MAPQNQSPAPSQVRITQLRRFDQNVPLAPVAQILTVRRYDNYLEIGFSTVNSLRAGDLVFRYHLAASIPAGWKPSGNSCNTKTCNLTIPTRTSRNQQELLAHRNGKIQLARRRARGYRNST
ncbi:MAG: transposase [candidate division KSB1 bacterium]|nr:transposase [candidate division KSB1 bacterium]MDZ7364420.1 transposase [candidate division KSB1 bacterium]MDZ7402792.1 transposase [candidate division KSB1 bacterium]